MLCSQIEKSPDCHSMHLKASIKKNRKKGLRRFCKIQDFFLQTSAFLCAEIEFLIRSSKTSQ